MAKDYFLDHPTVDKVFRVVIALARETYILRDRLALVETLLDEKGVVVRADLAKHEAGESEREELNEAAHAFVASILEPIVRDRVDDSDRDEA